VIGGRNLNFKWLVSDVVGAAQSKGTNEGGELLSSGPILLSKKALASFLDSHDLDLEWAVVSGFPYSAPLDVQALEVCPWADGNPMYWSGEPRIQHPLAVIEIVFWDGTDLLLLTPDHELSGRFLSRFSRAMELDLYNRVEHPEA
jgi:hypothetical protein